MDESVGQQHIRGVRYSCPLRPERRKPLEDTVKDRAVALGRLYAVEFFYSELIKHGVGTNEIEHFVDSSNRERIQRSVTKCQILKRDVASVRQILRMHISDVRGNIGQTRDVLRREAERLRFIRGIVPGTKQEKKHRSLVHSTVMEAKSEDVERIKGRIENLVKKYGSEPVYEEWEVRGNEDLLEGVLYKDDQLGFVDEEDLMGELDLMVSGGVELDRDEKAILSLPPNFCVFETLDEVRMKADSEEAAVKIRYNRKKEADEVDMEDWEVDIAREEELKGRLIV